MTRTRTPLVFAVLFLGAMAVGCGSNDSTAPDADGSGDAAQDTGGSDADTPDAGDDAASDAAEDAQPDVAPDVSPDVAPDVSPDVAPDVAPDVTPDAVSDVAPDAADVEEDTGPIVPPNCGDGEVQEDEGEECDDGNDDDLDECTTFCTVAACGDGIVGVSIGEVEETEVEITNLSGVSGPVCDAGASCPGGTCAIGTDDTAPEHGICQALGYPRALRVTWGGSFGAEADPAVSASNFACFDFECAEGTVDTEGACGEGRMLASIVCEGFAPEPCDDGDNGLGPNQCRPGCELPVCGDGVTDSEFGEDCDDANDVVTDGCNNCLFPSCGDGLVQVGEDCDDGNDDETDGCRSDCTFPACGDGVVQVGGGGFVVDEDFEAGFPANVGFTGGDWTLASGEYEGTQSARAAAIGSSGTTTMSFAISLEAEAEFSFAYRVSSESCCDGLRVTDNGTELLAERGEIPWTTATFTLAAGDHEIGFAYFKDGSVDTGEDTALVDAITIGVDFTYFEECDEGDANSELPNACRPTCVLPACGDLVVDDGEECDDGNDVNDDGCSNNCRLPGCGDGILQESEGEECDEGDGNADEADTCRLDCTLPTCLDGIQDTGEECDDGNEIADDGCSLICRVPGCRDGVIQEPEECDDGNDIAEDGCSNNCLTPQCGDGITQLDDPFFEECDDANDNDVDGCRNDCSLSFCGDGVQQTGVFQSFGSYDFEEPELPAEFRTVGAGWEFTDDASTGLQALVSADIDDNETAGFELDVNFPTEVLIRFDAKVSSEACCDELHVRRDGVDVLQVVGVAEYEPFEVAVPAGPATLSFAYEKDGSVSNGADAAWLDNLRFETASFDEQCDDGEGNANEPNICRTSCLLPACTDGILDEGEECDDGNNIADDGCSNNCLTPQCGDGVVQEGEACDDGNDSDNDGCLNDCTLAVCGDGIVNVPTRQETFATPIIEDPFGNSGFVHSDSFTCVAGGCDFENDGSLPEHFVCQALGFERATDATYGVPGIVGNIVSDLNWTCEDFECAAADFPFTPFLPNPDLILSSLTCIAEDPETCDDGELNADEADACRTDCVAPFCGDLIVDEGEECDDGNLDESDECTTACTTSVCGDGVISLDEECDDGEANADAADACRISCELPTCGDLIIDSGEDCDDGPEGSETCRADCVIATCGNGALDAGEACDDGNEELGDGCRPDCTEELCGDGITDEGEECDDGNDEDNDACKNDCTIGGAAGADFVLGPVTGEVLTGTTVGAGNDDQAEECLALGDEAEDVWVSWVAPSSGVFSIELCGSSFDTTLYVREGAIDGPIVLDALEVPACNDDEFERCGADALRQSVVDFAAEEGEIYVIVIDGYDGEEQGDFVLTINEL